jgi:uncharacterized integral membrane protein (TIGR00697 family)
MSNEIIFFGYLGSIITLLLVAVRLGPEALCSLIALQWVLANLFVTKTITLFGLHATASDALAVGAILGLNLIQEYFGKHKAQQSIIISFLCLLFYTIISALHIMYLPSTSDSMHPHFCEILTPMPRILLASFTVYVFVQYLDYVLYGFLLKIFRSRFFIVRNYISVGLTQGIDTILFSFLALYGTVNNIGQIILISYSIKLITLSLATPFLSLSRLFMPQK